MPPTTSRDFQKAAAQRLTTAETLLREKHTLDAQYLGGYTVVQPKGADPRAYALY